jgi:hypothetical protein
VADQNPNPNPAPGRTPSWSVPEPPASHATGAAFSPAGAVRAVPEKKRRPVLTHGAVALVALFVGVGIGGSSSADEKSASGATPSGPAATAPGAVPATAAATDAPTTTTAPPATTAAAPKPRATTRPGPATSFDGDGEYLVGEDIAAGTYRTDGPQDEIPCYWERDEDSSGSFESIIANNNIGGTGRVTLRAGEVFKSQRCQIWKKVG